MHRNLKIESILIDADGINDPDKIDSTLIKIIDWSLGIGIKECSTQNEEVGDLLYKAP